MIPNGSGCYGPRRRVPSPPALAARPAFPCSGRIIGTHTFQKYFDQHDIKRLRSWRAAS